MLWFFALSRSYSSVIDQVFKVFVFISKFAIRNSQCPLDQFGSLQVLGLKSIFIHQAFTDVFNRFVFISKFAIRNSQCLSLLPAVLLVCSSRLSDEMLRTGRGNWPY